MYCIRNATPNSHGTKNAFLPTFFFIVALLRKPYIKIRKWIEFDLMIIEKSPPNFCNIFQVRNCLYNVITSSQMTDYFSFKAHDMTTREARVILNRICSAPYLEL